MTHRLILVWLATAGLVAAGEPRAFTIPDLYRLKGVEDPQVSPDGKSVAYVVRTSDLPKAKRTARIWRVDVDTGDRRPLTSGEKSDSTPRWSPDGSTLAFVSTRSGSPQVWLLPARGGEATQLTTISGGVSDPLWTGDGKRIVFASDVHPGCADDPCNKKRDERREKGPVKAHVADALLYRHWASWRDGKRSHLFVVDLDTKKARDLTPGEFDAPGFQVGGPAAFDVSPDGTEVCFASNHDPDEAKSTNSDLWTVPLAGGEAKNLTAANRAWDGTPRYSPDGRFIAFRKQTEPGYESDRFRLALYDRRDGSIRSVSDSFDNWVEDFEWLPDNRRIAFLGPVRGKVPLHVIDVTDGSVRAVAELGTIDAFDLAPDAAWAAVARRKVGNPTEVFRVALAAGGEPKRLTFENEAIEREVDLRPAETIEVPGAGGRPVQVFIVKPHGFDPAKKYPLILNVHGGPQSQWADAFRGDWQVYPGAGYVVAFPNPHGSTGFGQEYTAAISKDWTGKVMEDVEKVTDALAKLPYVDAQRIGAMGWSWGGYAMMWLEGHSTRYKCLASMMGVYDLRAMYSSTEELWFPAWDLGGTPWDAAQLYAEHSPSNFVKNFRTPCLVIAGERDYRVPYTQSLEFFTDLQEMKVPSRLIVFDNAGHWPSWTEMALYYNAHLEWFQKWLGGSPAPWRTTEMADGGGPFTPEEPKAGS